MKINELKKISRNAHLVMDANPKDDANTRWEKKKVYQSTVLYDGSSFDNLAFDQKINPTINKEDYKTASSSFQMSGITYAEGISPRPTVGMTLCLDNVNLSKYNRLSFWIKPIAVGYENFYFHLGYCNDSKWYSDALSLEVNKWNHCVWEIEGLERNKVNRIVVTCFMMGCPPEALPDVTILVDSITAEVVDADYDLGWELDERIAYSHVGYFPNAKKTAIIGKTSAQTFTLINKKKSVVFENSVKKETTKLGTFYVLDFSEFTLSGEYKLVVGSQETEYFMIDQMCYDSSVWKSMNFLRSLRCGEDIEHVHSACHLNCRTTNCDGSSVPNFGGWHDAGDVSQFEICTAEMAHAILDLAEAYQTKDKDLYERLKEEAKVGTSWLLRTRFNDGNRVLQVWYHVWRDNVLAKDNDSVYVTKAENGPFENFIASAALAKASMMFSDDHIYAEWCKRSAISDFWFGVDGYKKGIHTVRWGSNIDAQTAGSGVLAAAELYLATNDVQYLTVAKEYAKIIMSCQETEETLKGFFYEDPKHTYMLSYEHRGHEQSPIQAIAKLMEIMPNDEDYNDWKKCLLLYKEYVMETLYATKPYGLMPGHVYKLDKINMERFTVPSGYGTLEEAHENLQRQIKQGIHLYDDTYLRVMPVAIQRRGFHATLLSKTKAVSMMAKVLKDDELKQICYDQFEWILGKNPFASSTMYGEGHNYHPLYVAFSRQMVGALPVGIMTKGDADLPYWPMATQAVYKEIWGHTTGKYLWVLADLLMME